MFLNISQISCKKIKLFAFKVILNKSCGELFLLLMHIWAELYVNYILYNFMKQNYISNKLIGVQSNHGVEYFGGPAAPTQRFLHN